MSVNSLGALDEIGIRIQALAVRLRFPNVQNIEDAETVEIGETYFINVAITRQNSLGAGAGFPVLGDVHDDADFITIYPDNVRHAHVDWRFIPADLYPAIVKLFLAFADQNPQYGWTRGVPNRQLASVIPESEIGSLERWPLPVARPQLKWEVYPDWLPALEAAYKDKKVECNTCPHRGISLSGAPMDEHGNRICPGHGLKWSKSGCLVPRTPK
jgi:hypothetical protein